MLSFLDVFFQISIIYNLHQKKGCTCHFYSLLLSSIKALNKNYVSHWQIKVEGRNSSGKAGCETPARESVHLVYGMMHRTETALTTVTCKNLQHQIMVIKSWKLNSIDHILLLVSSTDYGSGTAVA